MITINLIKTHLDLVYGFDVLKKSRKRKIVYARKVLITILVDYGFTHAEIKKEYDWIKHDICIFHRNTFNQITPIDLRIYNKCVEYFQLPIQIYNSVNGIDKNPSTASMIDTLLGLSRKDIKYFDNKIFKPFIRNLKIEQSIMS